MKRKTAKFLEAAIVIAVALAFIMPSSAVFANEENSMNKSVVKLTNYKLEKASPSDGLAIFEEEDVPVAAEPGDEQMPAIVKDNDGNLWVFYVLEDGGDYTFMIKKSTDDGQTWPDAWYLNAEGIQSYPVAAIDAHGMLWMAFLDEEQDTINFLQGQDPSVDPTEWLFYYFEPGDSINHRQMGSVATYQNGGRTVCAWGYILDVVYPPYSVDDAGVIEHNGAGEQWTYTWDSTWQGKPASHPSIGSSDDMFFFAFQYTDDVTQNEIIDVRWGDAVQQPDMEEWDNEFGTFNTSDERNSSKPSIFGRGNNVVMVYQSDENGNQDLLCSYSEDDGDTWTHNVVVVDDVADEENPRVFIVGTETHCLYTKDGNLYIVNSTDGGATWGDSTQINDVAGSVENEWRTAEICFPYLVWTDNRGDDLDIYFDIGGELPKLPHLVIGNISGGLGVSAVIINDGDADAIGVTPTLRVTGGILGLIDKELPADTTIDIPAGTEAEVSIGLFLGLGAIEVAVTASAPGVNTATGDATGTQFIIFTII